MYVLVIDGQKLAGDLRARVAVELHLAQTSGAGPGLATGLVGDDYAGVQQYLHHRPVACPTATPPQSLRESRLTMAPISTALCVKGKPGRPPARHGRSRRQHGPATPLSIPALLLSRRIDRRQVLANEAGALRHERSW